MGWGCDGSSLRHLPSSQNGIMDSECESETGPERDGKRPKLLQHLGRDEAGQPKMMLFIDGCR